MKRKKVLVVPYNKNWSKEFENTKAEIIEVLAQLTVTRYKDYGQNLL